MPDPQAPKPLRLVVAEGHALFRAGLRYLLQELAEAVELHEAATADELWDVLALGRHDLILIDHALFGADQHLPIRRVLDCAGGAPVAMISGLDDLALIRFVLEEGAAGFIPKNSSPRVMIHALRLVLAGGVYLPPTILSLLPKATRDDATDARPVALTTRQRDVWDHLAKGASNKQIARALNLSEGAVKAHVAGLLRLLGARSRTEALVRASEAGWLDKEGESQKGSPAGSSDHVAMPGAPDPTPEESAPKRSSRGLG